MSRRHGLRKTYHLSSWVPVTMPAVAAANLLAKVNPMASESNHGCSLEANMLKYTVQLTLYMVSLTKTMKAKVAKTS
jgi:hypothetical protein